jgi:hypothetical protein
MATRSAIPKKAIRPAARTRRGGRPSASSAPVASLRRAIRGFYDNFQKEKWELCYNRIDPNLLAAGNVDFNCYRDSLAAFKQRYGEVTILLIRIGEIHTGKQDQRPFAYASVIWRDRLENFHVFRERWIFNNGRWYTRVVGLVTDSEQPSSR